MPGAPPGCDPTVVGHAAAPDVSDPVGVTRVHIADARVPGTAPAMPAAGDLAQLMPTLAGAPTGSLPPAMPGATGSPSPVIAGARYVLGSEIARGGMGRVVDATDTKLDRGVALKEALATDVDTLRRFDRETRITARLEHPSIVPVYDAGESPNGSRFYVMRKVSGRPLERLVANAETLGERLALIPHIVDSAQAIAHAHARHIVHRDIKPANILVGELGETVVIDWGLAKVIGEPDEQIGRPLVDLSDALKTRAGVVYGTPGFMAPEQLRGAPVTEGCDVYALGATLYHLLSRKPPHFAKTADEMMKAAVAAPPTPIRELVEGVPRELEAIVDKALAHDPGVRYPNARALAEDLQRFLTGRLVAAHHYTPREKVMRFVRKNRGVSAAVAALIVIGSFAMVRIVIERNRADAAARIAQDQQAIAEQQRGEAIHRADELTLEHARDNVAVNPTKAVAMLKPLAASYWRDVRAIAAAARANGVAWGVAASKQTRSLELSADGRRALSAGSDGVIRLHDLANRTDRTIIDLRAPVMARFVDRERQVIAWHDAALAIVDARTGLARELATPTPILDLEVVGTTAYWVDGRHALWQLELPDLPHVPPPSPASPPGPPGIAAAEGLVPTEIPLDEPVHGLSPSPDGRWIALAGDAHLFLYDRNQPAQRPFEVTLGNIRQLAWAADGGHLAVIIDRVVLDLEMVPVPAIVQRVTVGERQFIAHSGGRMYTAGGSDVLVMNRSDGDVAPADREQLRGDAVGIAVARGGTVVVGASEGLTIISEDGDRVLPLQGAHVETIAASPHSPYVIAQLENRLLAWNLDDIQPRHLDDRPAGGALFASSTQVITGGRDDIPAQSIDVVTGAIQPLGSWPGLRSVAADGPIIAVLDDERHVHLISAATASHPARVLEDLAGEIDIAGFAISNKLVLATQGGAIYVHDVATHQRLPLVVGHSRLVGLAWGRGHHPWVAAAFLDGTLWRKNLTTGIEATAARIPRLDPAHPAQRDGKLIVGADGTVVFVHASELHAWRADGTLERIARLAKPIDELGEAGAGDLLAFAGDATIYGVSRAAPYQVTDAMPSIEATGAAMSPETGLLVVLEHGALIVVDPLVHQRWTLASPNRVTFDSPAISERGDRVLAQSRTGLLAWSIELPASAGDTAKWLEAMTNAVDDRNPGGLGWH
jgi:hypothetical protein